MAALGQIVGGLLSGVGQGMAAQGQLDIIARREAVLEQLRADREAARFEAQEGRADARARSTAEAQARLQTQRDEAAMERERVRAAARGKGGGSGRPTRGTQFQDEAGNLWLQPAGGGPAQPVTDASGKQLKGKASTVTGERRMAPSAAWDHFVGIHSERDYNGKPDETTTDWALVAKGLESSGYKTEAEAARRKVPKPAEAEEEPEKPGLLERAYSSVFGGDEPAAPAPGGAPALADANDAARDLPRGSDGKVDPAKLSKGAIYRLPDGRLTQFDGEGFVVLGQATK